MGYFYLIEIIYHIILSHYFYHIFLITHICVYWYKGQTRY